MARGWESKSVEAQQSEAAEKAASPRKQMTLAEAATFRQRETLRLARQKVLQQLADSGNPRFQKLMQDTLIELEERLRRLE